jgi:hypothetical protein
LEEITVYIDPNVGGVLFQAFAAIFAAVSGIVLVFSRQIRSGITRIRRIFRNSKKKGASSEEKNAEE